LILRQLLNNTATWFQSFDLAVFQYCLSVCVLSASLHDMV
jgi:hypothetical protein